jgi:hypothetical protein
MADVFRADIREAQKLLRELGDVDEQREFKAALAWAADKVAIDAKRRVPVRTGRARRAIKSSVSKTQAQVYVNKRNPEYYGWLDFGSRTPNRVRVNRTGAGGSVTRRIGPWANSGKGPAQGRFLYPALEAQRAGVNQIMRDAIDRITERIANDSTSIAQTS